MNEYDEYDEYIWITSPPQSCDQNLSSFYKQNELVINRFWSQNILHNIPRYPFVDIKVSRLNFHTTSTEYNMVGVRRGNAKSDDSGYGSSKFMPQLFHILIR